MTYLEATQYILISDMPDCVIEQCLEVINDLEKEFELEEKQCLACNGSGEGMYSDSTCNTCSGKGEVKPFDIACEAMGYFNQQEVA